MSDLTICIPARQEEFLPKTIENILENIEGNTEVIAVLDGYKIETPKDPRVTTIYHSKSIGQRAATNEAARLSNSKYVMKLDAHCSFDKGFDVKMMQLMQDNYTMVPVMRNLWGFDWVCDSGHRRYQGPEGPCKDCGKETHKEIVWIGKTNPQSIGYRFDKNLHFQYHNEYGKKQTGDLTETMSLQGSCFMCTREKYFELNLCDENYGSWGQQGVEVACKTWLSGGRVVVNRTTWYVHMFRTQPGFSFPWPVSGRAQERARTISKDIWFNNKWDKAIHPFQWLIDKFSPVPGWETVSKGIVYYTDNQADLEIMAKCQKQLMKVESDQLPIISVSLKPIDFGVNYVLPLERGHLTMFKQILEGLEKSTADIIFFCEHDVLYHPSHFNFIPTDKDTIYYNTNVWKVRMSDGHGLYVDNCRQTSGICAFRETLIAHYKERVEYVEKNGYDHNMGFEPGTHGRVEWKLPLKSETWKSELPNIDIRHDNNLTPNRWTKEEFRNQKNTEGWLENDNIPGYGHLWHFWKRI